MRLTGRSSGDFSAVRLGDGRHLAYKERGLPKEQAKHKIILVHAFGDSKGFKLPISEELLKELQIYLLQFDRAGYGESDPNPKRSVKSDALDIQELADKLQLGPKFYVIGISIGAYPVYGCLKYIPHSPSDLEILEQLDGPQNEEQEKVKQQGTHESLYRDLMVGLGRWEFGPTDISNPFPNNEGYVHMWQGYEDKVCRFEMNRYIAERLPWIQYHEVAGAGHLLIYKAAHCEAIFRALVSS
ncbi:UNVERIFIED_CONTAM: hypothetical protein Sradi_0410700 [Sesamum radiatum]|uniref:AB hydrolase-1 domain-containing protein n=1 Tax=Sesamum radiatum TaxID=300843 RepID=A0AAW2W6H3_SESRA